MKWSWTIAGIAALTWTAGSPAAAAIPVVQGEGAVLEAAQYYAAGNKGRALTLIEAAVIHDNVRALLARHSYIQHGTRVLDADLEHFHDEHCGYAPAEEALAARLPGRFRVVFAERVDHIRVCPVCASVVRESLLGTGIPVVEFEPDTAGMPLRCAISVEGRWVPVSWLAGPHGPGFYGTRGAYFGQLMFLEPAWSPTGCFVPGSGLVLAGHAADPLQLGGATRWFASDCGRFRALRFSFESARTAPAVATYHRPTRKPDAPVAQAALDKRFLTPDPGIAAQTDSGRSAGSPASRTDPATAPAVTPAEVPAPAVSAAPSAEPSYEDAMPLGQVRTELGSMIEDAFDLQRRLLEVAFENDAGTRPAKSETASRPRPPVAR